MATVVTERLAMGMVFIRVTAGGSMEPIPHDTAGIRAIGFALTTTTIGPQSCPIEATTITGPATTACIMAGTVVTAATTDIKNRISNLGSGQLVGRCQLQSAPVKL